MPYFFMIGLMCNSLGCYWVKVDEAIYQTQKQCVDAAVYYKSRTAMYFDFGCETTISVSR